MSILPFDCLQAGECGRVCDISGQSECVQRLQEMGICYGSELQMLYPGSPCLVCVNGQRFSLRLETEVDILVEAAV